MNKINLRLIYYNDIHVVKILMWFSLALISICNMSTSYI